MGTAKIPLRTIANGGKDTALQQWASQAASWGHPFLLRFDFEMNGKLLVVDPLAAGATLLLPSFLLGSFEKLLNYVMFTDTLSIALVASTIFVLRRRATGDGSFSVPGYPLLPAIYIVCLLGVAASVLVTQPRLAFAGIVVLLVGWPLFRLGRRLSGAGAA